MTERVGSPPPPEFSRATIAERDGWVCGICGGEVDTGILYPDPMFGSIDHIIPVTRDGTNDPDNLRLTHLACNLDAPRGPLRKPRADKGITRGPQKNPKRKRE